MPHRASRKGLAHGSVRHTILDLSIAVQIQAHPARADLAEKLAATLGDAAQIVYDPAPADPVKSPWRTYRHCIQTAPPDASHLLVIQEDATVCDGFVSAARAAIAARPDRLLVLCVTGQGGQHRLAVQKACQRGESWAELPVGHWISAICNCWPVDLALDLVEWVDAQNYPLRFVADDEIIGRWARGNWVTPLASVPSLAQHPDIVPSVMSRRQRNGSNPTRQAAIFVDEDCDMSAAEIDWNLGPGG